MRWVVLALVGCYTSVEHPRTPPPSPPPRPPQAIAADDVYPLDEAIADVLSSPLVYVGTGPYFGIFRINVCLYRNERVLVVNVYCTPKEMSSFRVDVWSPTRGRVYIYAEAAAPISQIPDRDYFTFKAESEPPPPPGKIEPHLTLGMSVAQLHVYAEQRYKADLPGCYGGIEITRRPNMRSTGQCRLGLAPHAKAWAARNTPFLDAPGPSWHRLVDMLRRLAPRDGKHVAHPGG